MLKRVFGFAASAAIIIGLPMATYLNRYNIIDWWRLRGYEPSREVSQLSDMTTMTSYAQRLFYVHKPELDDKATFTERCKGSEKTIVLGCYKRQEGIYILLVNDKRLAGAMEVTAAHEMLHAAYDRMGSSEKNLINGLLIETREKLTSERVKSTLQGYEDRDPDSIYTEMHSIFGTELRNLSPELEEHYAKYFSDRTSVVAISEKYEQVFVDIRAKVEAYDTDIAIRKKAIAVQEETIKVTSEELQQNKAYMDQLLAQNARDAYNNEVPAYNQRVRDYNEMVNRLKQEIDEFNSLVELRNSVSLEQQELIKTLDASTAEVAQ